MKKTIATLIAGLFATAAFAQTPATPATTTVPAAKAEAKHEKQAAKAEVKETKAVTKAEVKEAKVEAKHAKAEHKATKKAEEHKDTTVAAVTPASK